MPPSICSSSSPLVIAHQQRGAPVDVHVLHFGEPHHYLDQCLASLETEPVNVWIIRGGFPDNIGAARAFAVSLGKAPYWSFVDADDWIAPGSAAHCTELLDTRPDLVGVYTDYQCVAPDGRLLGIARKHTWTPLRLLEDCWEVLHYHQYRRAPTEPYLSGLANTPCYEETYIAGMLARHGDFLHLPKVGYYKRDGGQSIRLQNAQLLRCIYRDITPALMQAQQRWTEMKRAA